MSSSERNKDNSDTFPEDLPTAYLNFLKANPNGDEHNFCDYADEDPEECGRYWNLMSQSELMKSWEMRGVGSARNFESLTLDVKLYREYATSEFTPSNVGKIALDRVAAGFVIGNENGDYLYLDPADAYSVWIYFHDGGDVRKIADTFEQFINSELIDPKFDTDA